MWHRLLKPAEGIKSHDNSEHTEGCNHPMKGDTPLRSRPEGSEDDSDDPFADYGPESHEAFIACLRNDVAEALDNPE